ncbi:MAG: 50S ribosomal protein L9 [Fastidiosipilaceae bacterium]|jgi:large subunit ribosomal protein L9
MKVILLEDVKSLGKADDIVDVAPGYANNFLLKKGLALEATKENMNVVRTRKKALNAKEAQNLAEAKAMGEELSGKSFTMVKKVGEGGKLYGTLTSMDVANCLKEAGYTVDKRGITIQTALKSIGSTDVTLKLHNEVSVDIRVDVIAE